MSQKPENTQSESPQPDSKTEEIELNAETSQELPKKKPQEKKEHKSSKSSPARPAKPHATDGASKEKATTKRVTRSFPACTFEEALEIPNAIQQFASGQPIRRLTLFDHLEKSADSSGSRQAITNSNRYGLTSGSYQADHISLTDDGQIVTNIETRPVERLRAQFRLAIENVAPFKALYDRFAGSRLPSQAVMRDFLLDAGYKKDEVSECIDTFVLNTKYLGLLREIAGAERLLTIDHATEELPKASPPSENLEKHISPELPAVKSGGVGWDKICFYITPIGEPESEERKHADLFLNHIVEPALEEFGLKVVRADKIGKPGMISAQVIQHVVRARLVVVDLSFHNPNVFYELSLRHACCLPTVQVIRADDKIPFDLKDFNTITIDTASIFTLIPKLETYKSEIANQVRRVLNNPDSIDNPIMTFCPGLKVHLPPEIAARAEESVATT